MIDLSKEIWQTLKTNKLRTLLTGMSVAWGIFMLIMLLGMAKGVINSFSSSDFAKSANVIQLWPGKAAKAYHGLKEGRRVNLKEHNLADIERDNHAHVSEAAPELSSASVKISTTKDYITKNYSGVYPEAKEQKKMIHGRFINENDLDKQRKVMVLSLKTAALLFDKPDEAIGKTVNMSGLSFTIVGIYEHRWQDRIYIPYTTAKALNAYSDKLSTIRVTTKPLSTAEEANNLENDIRATLGKVNSHAADDDSAVWVWNRFANYLSHQEGMKILNIVMWVIGMLTLITGIVGVSNIMFVSVRERTHEIGIRRAIGAKPRSILSQVIVESVALTTIFGYIGIIMGTIGTTILDNMFGSTDFIKNPTVDISIALEVTAVLIIAGALAGLFPAMRALKIKPVEALRTE
ncbi:MAG: ABC transporter permease [Lachnospiraceae bacterium]|nr:ABC transporter permease [Lachnospiraceae bacterium]